MYPLHVWCYAGPPQFPDANPTEPPVISNVAGSQRLYFINLTATSLPQVAFRLGFATLIIQVEDSTGYPPAYYVLVSVSSFSLVI